MHLYIVYGEVQYIPIRRNFASILSYVGPTHESCTEITSMPTTSSRGRSSAMNSHLTDVPTDHPPTDSATEAPNGPTEEPRALTVPSTEPPKRMTASVPTAQLPSKVVGVRVTPSVQDTFPTLTVVWHALASGAVTYTVNPTRGGEHTTRRVL